MDNTLLDLPYSSNPTQPHSLIAKYVEHETAFSQDFCSTSLLLVTPQTSCVDLSLVNATWCSFRELYFKEMKFVYLLIDRKC